MTGNTAVQRPHPHFAPHNHMGSQQRSERNRLMLDTLWRWDAQEAPEQGSLHSVEHSAGGLGSSLCTAVTHSLHGASPRLHAPSSTTYTGEPPHLQAAYQAGTALTAAERPRLVAASDSLEHSPRDADDWTASVRCGAHTASMRSVALAKEEKRARRRESARRCRLKKKGQQQQVEEELVLCRAQNAALRETEAVWQDKERALQRLVLSNQLAAIAHADPAVQLQRVLHCRDQLAARYTLERHRQAVGPGDRGHALPRQRSTSSRDALDSVVGYQRQSAAQAVGSLSCHAQPLPLGSGVLFPPGQQPELLAEERESTSVLAVPLCEMRSAPKRAAAGPALAAAKAGAPRDGLPAAGHRGSPLSTQRSDTNDAVLEAWESFCHE